MIRRAGLSVLLAVLGAGGVSAQAESPRAVAEQLWDAVQAGDWRRAAHFTHPDAMHQLRELVAPLVDATGVAGDSLRMAIYGTVSKRDAASVSDSAVYANMMLWGRSLQGSKAAAVGPARYAYIGTVNEGQDTVHVLGRASAHFLGRDQSWIQVTSLLRYGNTWRGLVQPDLSQLAWAMRSSRIGSSGAGP